jgi:hypothetical protein
MPQRACAAVCHIWCMLKGVLMQRLALQLLSADSSTRTAAAVGRGARTCTVVTTAAQRELAVSFFLLLQLQTLRCSSTVFALGKPQC